MLRTALAALHEAQTTDCDRGALEVASGATISPVRESLGVQCRNLLSKS